MTFPRCWEPMPCSQDPGLNGHSLLRASRAAGFHVTSSEVHSETLQKKKEGLEVLEKYKPLCDARKVCWTLAEHFSCGRPAAMELLCAGALFCGTYLYWLVCSV